jgi:hypothetical protein
MATPAEGFVSVEMTVIVALIRGFGEVLQMPSVAN